MISTFLNTIGYSVPDYLALPPEQREEIFRGLEADQVSELQTELDALENQLRTYEGGLSRDQLREERDYLGMVENQIREMEQDLGQAGVEENQLTREVDGDLQISEASTPLDGQTHVFNLNAPPSPDAVLEQDPTDPTQEQRDVTNDGFLTHADIEAAQLQSDHLPLLNIFFDYGADVKISLAGSDPSTRSYIFKCEGPEGHNFVILNNVDPASVGLIFNSPTEPSDPVALVEHWSTELTQISYPFNSRKSFAELAEGEVTLEDRLAVIPEYSAVKNGLAGVVALAGVSLDGMALTAAQKMVDTLFTFIDSTDPQKDFMNDAWTPSVQGLAGLDDKTRAQALQAVILSLAQSAPNLLSHMPAEAISGAEGFLSLDTAENSDEPSVASKLSIAVLELYGVGAHGGGQTAIDTLFGSGPEAPYIPGIWKDAESNRIVLNKLKAFDRGTLSTPLDETIKVQDGPFLSEDGLESAGILPPFPGAGGGGGGKSDSRTVNWGGAGFGPGYTVGYYTGYLNPAVYFFNGVGMAFGIDDLGNRGSGYIYGGVGAVVGGGAGLIVDTGRAAGRAASRAWHAATPW